MMDQSSVQGKGPAEPRFRLLLGPGSLPSELGRAALAEAYVWPDGTTVRANMIASLDGAVTGFNGRSGTLSDAADRAVFDTLRASCDAIVVGAGTARTEHYGPPAPGRLLVVVSRSGQLPDRLRAASDGVVLVIPESSAASVPPSLAADQVWVLGGADVPPAAVLERLRARGRSRILHEGGPRLLSQWLAAGCVDEFCLTRAARLLGGGPGLLPRPVGDLRVRLQLLLESGGTLLGRWRVVHRD